MTIQRQSCLTNEQLEVVRQRHVAWHTLHTGTLRTTGKFPYTLMPGESEQSYSKSYSESYSREPKR